MKPQVESTRDPKLAEPIGGRLQRARDLGRPAAGRRWRRRGPPAARCSARATTSRRPTSTSSPG